MLIWYIMHIEALVYLNKNHKIKLKQAGALTMNTPLNRVKAIIPNALEY